MSSHKPLLPLRPAAPAEVVPLHQRRPFTLDPATIARRAAAQRIKTLNEIDHSVSNNETTFRAMAAFLLQMQQRGKVTTFGATLGRSEAVVEHVDFWERPATLSLGGIDYAVTLFSIRRAAGPREKDTTYPKRRIDESIMLLEDGDNRYYVYAEQVANVPQIANPRRWLVISGAQDDATVESFERFIERHHPDYKIEADTCCQPPALDSTLRGCAIGTHRARGDSRFLQLVPAPQAAAVPAKDEARKKRACVKTRTVAKKAPQPAKSSTKKATARNSAAVKKRAPKPTRPKNGSPRNNGAGGAKPKPKR